MPEGTFLRQGPLLNTLSRASTTNSGLLLTYHQFKKGGNSSSQGEVDCCGTLRFSFVEENIILDASSLIMPSIIGWKLLTANRLRPRKSRLIISVQRLKQIY